LARLAPATSATDFTNLSTHCSPACGASVRKHAVGLPGRVLACFASDILLVAGSRAAVTLRPCTWRTDATLACCDRCLRMRACRHRSPCSCHCPRCKVCCRMMCGKQAKGASRHMTALYCFSHQACVLSRHSAFGRNNSHAILVSTTHTIAAISPSPITSCLPSRLRSD
jgi:hypothetical protein